MPEYEITARILVAAQNAAVAEDHLRYVLVHEASVNGVLVEKVTRMPTPASTREQGS